MAFEIGKVASQRLRALRVLEQRTAEAAARAEGLLLDHLTPEQATDWMQNRAFNVRGSQGWLYRLDPGKSPHWWSIAREDGLGTAAWPVGLDIPADWALAMMLYLQANEVRVLGVGCQVQLFNRTTSRYLRRSYLISDYGGKL